MREKQSKIVYFMYFSGKKVEKQSFSTLAKLFALVNVPNPNPRLIWRHRNVPTSRVPNREQDDASSVQR